MRVYVVVHVELRASIMHENNKIRSSQTQSNTVNVWMFLDSRLTTSSSNARVSVGSTVTFKCATDSDRDIRWYFCGAPRCDKPTIVYNGDELHPTLLRRFAVTVLTARSPAHSSQLSITDVELGDSGTYSCAEADTFSTRRHFVLHVLGKMSK